MTTPRYVPPIPTTEMVAISREALAVLSLVELTANSHRLLTTLLAYQDPETGCAGLSQVEMGTLLGLSAPSVNRAVKQLADKGLAWLLEPGVYQIHPLLTGGKMRAGLASVPKIDSLDPERFGERMRQRYEGQLANLGISA
ncbi:winged helix-turn-helix transcriptional regulator [Kitasatospora sp. NPDC086009]|uniref:winged helix-turn-helix transcriptional regulator n=1 Tax=unclassified Kitasatospora TaxID=2633591 RepID=UPI0037CAE63E